VPADAIVMAAAIAIAACPNDCAHCPAAEVQRLALAMSLAKRMGSEEGEGASIVHRRQQDHLPCRVSATFVRHANGSTVAAGESEEEKPVALPIASFLPLTSEVPAMKSSPHSCQVWQTTHQTRSSTEKARTDWQCCVVKNQTLMLPACQGIGWASLRASNC